MNKNDFKSVLIGCFTIIGVALFFIVTTYLIEYLGGVELISIIVDYISTAILIIVGLGAFVIISYMLGSFIRDQY